MIDVKVSLDIAIPGVAIDSQSLQLKTVEKEKIITTKRGKKVKKHFKDQIEDWSNADVHSFNTFDKKANKSQTIHYATAKRLPAIIHTNIRNEEYLYWISIESCPVTIKPFKWRQMSKKQRVEAHCNLIAEYHQGKLLSFHIFED